MDSVVLLTALGVLGIEDGVKKQVHVILIYALGIAGVIYHILFGNISTANMIAGGFVGAILYFISLVTKEKIGKADGLLFISTGFFLGFWDNSVLLICSCVIAAAFGLLYIKVRGEKWDYSLPFIPFVAIAYAALLFIRWLIT